MHATRRQTAGQQADRSIYREYAISFCGVPKPAGTSSMHRGAILVLMCDCTLAVLNRRSQYYRRILREGVTCVWEVFIALRHMQQNDTVAAASTLSI